MNRIKNERIKNECIKNECIQKIMYKKWRYKKWNYKKWMYKKRKYKKRTYKKKNWSFTDLWRPMLADFLYTLSFSHIYSEFTIRNKILFCDSLKRTKCSHLFGIFTFKNCLIKHIGKLNMGSTSGLGKLWGWEGVQLAWIINQHI